MNIEARFRQTAKQRGWRIRRAGKIATNMIAAVGHTTAGAMACKIGRDASVVVYHGPTAALMLHPRAKTKFNQFLSF